MQSRTMTFTLYSLLVAAFMMGGPIFADAQWDANHPRRDQVNDRLAHQNARINQGVRNGTLSRQEARQLHNRDRHIRNQERRMASRNGGHITKGEQAKLNREENRTSRKIYNEKHGQ